MARAVTPPPDDPAEALSAAYTRGLRLLGGRELSEPAVRQRLAAAGLAVFLLSGLAGAFFYTLAPRLAESPGGIAAVYAIAGVGFSILDACGLGLLVAGVVADRGPR